MGKKHVAKQYELLSPAVVTTTTSGTAKPRYSYSQVETAKCGYRYYAQKILKAPREETYNLVAGTLLDTAFNAYYENNEHLNESHEERLAYARRALELKLEENPQWLTMPWSTKAGDVRSSPENYLAWLFDVDAISLICRHDRGPVQVQLKVELELPNYVIMGYIDCLELNTNTIVDVKAVTGWSANTALTYALRSQVPLYRMLYKDSTGVEAHGRYELLMCRKTPKYVSVPDYNIDRLQEQLVADFDAHHNKLVKKQFSKNPHHCFDFNKKCGLFEKCWPELAGMSEQPTNT